jgi:cytochrome P450
MIVIYNLNFHPLSQIPGPSSWSCSRLPFVWALIRGTIVHDIERLHQKYGPVLRIAPNEVTFASKEAWNDIFQSRPNHQPFLKDPKWWSSQPGHPNSIINAIDPEVHARIRRSLAPGFTLRALRHQESFIQRYVNLLVERIEQQTDERKDGRWLELDISPWLNYTTFDIFGELGFGESFDCLQHSRYHPWIALLFNSVKAAGFIVATRFYPLVEFLLMKCIPPSLKQVQKDHYQQIVDKVDRRLNWEVQQPDIISHVIQEQSEGKGLTTGEISATFMVLTTAGSETTATTLCGAINYLMAHPEKLIKLTGEIRSAFQNLEQITLDSLQNLSYLNAVIQEALRLCPAIPWILPRIVPAGGDTVCGTWLPGGVSLHVAPYHETIYLTRLLYRLRYLSKRGRSTATLDTSTTLPHSSLSGGSLIPPPWLTLRTITTTDRPYNLSAQAHVAVWVSIWRGLRCALYYPNCFSSSSSEPWKAKVFDGKTSGHSC